MMFKEQVFPDIAYSHLGEVIRSQQHILTYIEELTREEQVLY